MELEIGKAYFMVGFSTSGSEVPTIDTYIYIGLDIFSEGKSEYYFQTPESYFKHGNFTEIQDKNIRSKIQLSFMAAEIVEIMYGVEQLASYLLELKNRNPNSFGLIQGREIN